MATERSIKFVLFDTTLGRCGVVWNRKGLLEVKLPLASPTETKEAILRAFPDSKESVSTGIIRKVVLALTEMMSGQKRDFSFVPLNLSNMSGFDLDVYKAARQIPFGKTVSYGSLAVRIGRPRAHRAVGTALGKNPFPIVVPCHRVLAANGQLCGFSAANGVITKGLLLQIEGYAGLAKSLNYDLLESAEYLKKTDGNLAEVIRMVGPPAIDPPRRINLFQSLTRAVVGQQLSVTAAKAIYSRLCDKFAVGRGRLVAKNIMLASESSLLDCGLSRNKAMSVKELAVRSESRSLPTAHMLKIMTDEEIIEALISIRGIGRWTVEMILIFDLGRADVLAVGDLGLRKGHAILTGCGRETEAGVLAGYAERWRPFRSAASWYLWRLNNLPLKNDYLATFKD